jgi:hypothetical protein
MSIEETKKESSSQRCFKKEKCKEAKFLEKIKVTMVADSKMTNDHSWDKALLNRWIAS